MDFKRQTVIAIKLDSNVGILNDSYWGTAPTSSNSYLTFYQSNSNFRSDFARGKGMPLCTYIFSENTMYKEYQRTKYNLIDILSELGGLYSSLYLIGFAFTISFSYDLFISSIIRVIYHFPARFDSEIAKKKNKKSKSKNHDASDSDENEGRNPDGRTNIQNTIADGNSMEEGMLLDIDNRDLTKGMNPYTHEET